MCAVGLVNWFKIWMLFMIWFKFAVWSAWSEEEAPHRRGRPQALSDRHVQILLHVKGKIMNMTIRFNILWCYDFWHFICRRFTRGPLRTWTSPRSRRRRRPSRRRSRRRRPRSTAHPPRPRLSDGRAKVMYRGCVILQLYSMNSITEGCVTVKCPHGWFRRLAAL